MDDLLPAQVRRSAFCGVNWSSALGSAQAGVRKLTFLGYRHGYTLRLTPQGRSRDSYRPCISYGCLQVISLLDSMFATLIAFEPFPRRRYELHMLSASRQSAGCISSKPLPLHDLSQPREQPREVHVSTLSRFAMSQQERCDEH